eukprot:FR736739.1.p1 GENE.FR736739.1~~FR736739.1.p1  ORF type:complete len:334 (+),score=73.95 FR736739.1:142-1002(+)
MLIEKGIITKEQALVAKLGEDPTPEQLDKVAEILVKEKLDQMGFFDVEPPPPPTAHELAAAADLDELDELEDDEFGLDDESFMAGYREARLAEMRTKALTDKYGTVEEITKGDWLREVNEASKCCWVLCHLYQSQSEDCGIMDRCLTDIARKFKDIKCVKIVSTAAVENFPDRNLPALFMYHDGEMQHQLITLASIEGKGARPADLEWYLSKLNVVKTHMEEPPPPPQFKITTHTSKAGSRFRGVGGARKNQIPTEEGPNPQRRATKKTSRKIQNGRGCSFFWFFF